MGEGERSLLLLQRPPASGAPAGPWREFDVHSAKAFLLLCQLSDYHPPAGFQAARSSDSTGNFSPRGCFRGHSCTGLSLPGRREQTGSEDKGDQGGAVTLFPSLFVGCGKPTMVNSAEIAWKIISIIATGQTFPLPSKAKTGRELR